ncbi:MAG: hypothetical protein V4602_18580 [Pseudomonadota bacterium]
MTSITPGTNPYAQLGSAFARTAAATQPSLLDAINAADTASSSDPNAATNLTLSDAAKARMVAEAKTPDFTTVTNDARAALDKLYAAAKVSGPLTADGKTTVDLSALDRRALFAIATNSNGKFTADEQSVASGELTNRFNAALAPAAAATSMTKNYTVVYKAALEHLDGASSEEKGTAAWSAQRAAVLKGYDAAKQKPDTAPSGITGDPVASYLTLYPDGAPVGTTKTFSTVATNVRAALDAQASLAAEKGTELVYDPARKFGQLVDFSSIDNRSLSAITLNQDQQFSNQEIYAAKKELSTRTRMSILESLKQSQQSGDPTQLSLGILQSYSAMSDEERQASGWSPSFRDTAIQSYKTTSNILSMLQGS